MSVLGMGNALVDVIIPISNDQLLADLNLPKGSMQLLDDAWLKKIQEETGKLKSELSSGGSAANTIHGLAALSVSCDFVGAIGEDDFGHFFSKDLSDHHITPRLKTMDYPTGRAMAMVSQDSERTFGTYLGAAMLLAAEHLDPAYFSGHEYLYIEGYLVQNHTLIETAVKMAKEAGLKVALDLASYNVVDENKAFLAGLLENYVDLVFANEEEALSMTGLVPEEAVRYLHGLCETAVVKEGAKGAWAMKQDTLTKIDAVKASPIDTSGAGDSFAAGFIYGEIKDLSVQQSGSIGALIAARVIEFMGPKLPETEWEKLRGEIRKIGNNA